MCGDDVTDISHCLPQPPHVTAKDGQQVSSKVVFRHFPTDKHTSLVPRLPWRITERESAWMEISLRGTAAVLVEQLVNLLPKPPPRFFLAAAEKIDCEIKLGRRLGNESSIW